ncbi:MAG: GGDEF domain-containing protein [Halodesulfovibrio sp.]
MRTALTIYVLVSYVCAYLMGATFKVSRKRFGGVGYFFLNFACQSVGMTLALMRPGIPQFFSIIVANVLMLSGIISFTFGAAKFTHRKIPRLPFILYIGIFTGAFLHFTYTTPDTQIRTMLFSAMLIPLFLYTAFILLNPADASFRQHCKFTGNAFLLFTMLFLIRLYITYTGGPIPDYINGHSPDVIVNMLTTLLTVLLLYSVQHMISSRLFVEFEALTEVQAGMLLKMERLATKDHLTGAYNRRKIEEIIRYEIARHNRYNEPLSLILCDIDHFKSINDSFGHDTGDKVIIHTIDLITAHKRDTDMAGRWGGEEFIIVSPQTNAEHATAMAERLRCVIESHQPECALGQRKVTVSFGVAQYAPGSSVEAFVKCADKALYRAKQRGRNTVVPSPGSCV